MGGQVWMLDESFQTQIVGFRREVSHSRPPVLENFDHIVGPQFSRKISNFLVTLFFFAELCKFPCHLYFPKNQRVLQISWLSTFPQNFQETVQISWPPYT